MTKHIILFAPGVLLFLLLFVHPAFADQTCPSGCECISGPEFMSKYGRIYTTADYCPSIPFADCGYDPVHKVPRFCFKISSECGNSECEEGEDEKNCPEDCIGSADASKGGGNPGSHDWFYNASSTDLWNEMLQIKITAGPQEDISLVNMTLTASGTGDDAKGINALESYWDRNSDGVVDENDVKIGSAQPAYDKDNGKNTVALSLNIGKGKTRNILVVYIMSLNASFGETYQFTVDALNAKGQDSGKPFSVNGFPMTSGIKTITKPPPPSCSGNVSLVLNPNPAKPSDGVNATINGLQNCANKTTKVFAVPCNFLIALLPMCSCNVGWGGSGCSCSFDAPSQEGNYTYYGCVDINGDLSVDIGESDSAVLKVKIEEQPQNNSDENTCVLDGDCKNDEVCVGGACELVTGTCGYAANHSWKGYECGAWSGCPTCLAGKICRKNNCLPIDVQVPGNVFVGDVVTVKVLVDGQPTPNEEVAVTDPTGNSMAIATDSNGNGKFAVDYAGNYTVTFGAVSKTSISTAKAASLADLFNAVVVFIFEDPLRTTLAVIAIALAIGAIWFLRRKIK